MTEKLYFFNEETAHFALTKKLSESDIAFFKSIGINHNSRVLDQCCGRGVLANTLANVFQSKNLGLDIVPSYIDYAKNEASKNRLTTKFEVADVLNNKCFGRFDYVINWNTSWAYYEEDKDNLVFFENAFKNLKEGGKFILDFYNADWINRNFMKERKSNEIIDNKHYEIIKIAEIDDAFLIAEWLIKQDSKIVFKQSFKTRMYTIEEIVNLLKKAGFNNIDVKDRFSLDSFSEKSEKVIFTSTK